MIKDSLVSGAIAGGIGGIGQNIYAYAANLIGYNGPGYVDYGKILIWINNYDGTLANLIGFIGHITWDILLGILFAYIISRTSSRYLITKGILYGAIIWFLIQANSTLFKLPTVTGFEPITMGFFLIGSLFFGLILSYSLSVLESMKAKI